MRKKGKKKRMTMKLGRKKGPQLGGSTTRRVKDEVLGNYITQEIQRRPTIRGKDGRNVQLVPTSGGFAFLKTAGPRLNWESIKRIGGQKKKQVSKKRSGSGVEGERGQIRGQSVLSTKK